MYISINIYVVTCNYNYTRGNHKIQDFCVILKTPYNHLKTSAMDNNSYYTF